MNYEQLIIAFLKMVIYVSRLNYACNILNLRYMFLFHMSCIHNDHTLHINLYQVIEILLYNPLAFHTFTLMQIQSVGQKIHQCTDFDYIYIYIGRSDIFVTLNEMYAWLTCDMSQSNQNWCVGTTVLPFYVCQKQQLTSNLGLPFDECFKI